MLDCNKTSFELATGHSYHGKLALFGESTLFKKIIKFKGNNFFERGVWAGKLILTPDGAFEARTIRRLATGENFIATDIVIAKGLPWSYSPQGILMRHAGQTQRTRQPALEMGADDNEMRQIATGGIRDTSTEDTWIGSGSPRNTHLRSLEDAEED